MCCFICVQSKYFNVTNVNKQVLSNHFKTKLLKMIHLSIYHLKNGFNWLLYDFLKTISSKASNCFSGIKLMASIDNSISLSISLLMNNFVAQRIINDYRKLQKLKRIVTQLRFINKLFFNLSTKNQSTLMLFIQHECFSFTTKWLLQGTRQSFVANVWPKFQQYGKLWLLCLSRKGCY